MIMESMNAYADGKRDAEQGKPKKNASDFWGPYAGDYQHGYEQHKLIGEGDGEMKKIICPHRFS